MKKLKSRRRFIKNLALAGAATTTALANPSFTLAQENSMNAIQAILTRRSIDKFTDQKVSEEQINLLLQCAMAAPSAGSKRPWEFIVTRDQEKMKKFGYSAPVGILCCINAKEEFMPELGSIGRLDVVCAIENILIAANAIGLGASWKAGIAGKDAPFDKYIEKLRAVYNFPDYIFPVTCIVVGYPDETGSQDERYNPTKIHIETWLD